MGLFSRRRGPSGRAKTEDQARAIAAFAIAASAVDGQIDIAESAEMIELAARLDAFRNIKSKKHAGIFKAVWTDVSERGLPTVLNEAVEALSPELRETAFYVAARIALSDGRIDPAEKSFLIDTAIHLGVSVDRMEQLMEDACGAKPPKPSKKQASRSKSTSKQVPPSEQATPKEKKTPLFDAYILLSEPVQFHSTEIRDALMEDYPELDIDVSVPGVLDMHCDTAEFITVPLIAGQPGEDACLASLIRLPGYGTWDVNALDERQKRLVKDLDARMMRNASYICVSVSAKSNEITDVFRAARLCSCLTAVFSRLPVALAVYWEAGDHFLTPEHAITMADEAMEETWPLMSWMSVDLQSGPVGDTTMTQVLTKGASYFLPYELLHAYAPVGLNDAATSVMTACWMALEGGHSFGDGDTLGHEEQSIEASYSLRYIPKDALDAPQDLLVLIHPQSMFDADKIVGEHSSNPPPPGVEAKVRSQPGFFKRMMRGGQRVN